MCSYFSNINSKKQDFLKCFSTNVKKLNLRSTVTLRFCSLDVILFAWLHSDQIKVNMPSASPGSECQLNEAVPSNNTFYWPR